MDIKRSPAIFRSCIINGVSRLDVVRLLFATLAVEIEKSRRAKRRAYCFGTAVSRSDVVELLFVVTRIVVTLITVEIKKYSRRARSFDFFSLVHVFFTLTSFFFSFLRRRTKGDVLCNGFPREEQRHTPGGSQGASSLEPHPLPAAGERYCTTTTRSYSGIMLLYILVRDSGQQNSNSTVALYSSRPFRSCPWVSL